MSDLVGNPEDRFSRVAAQCGVRKDRDTTQQKSFTKLNAKKKM